MESVELASKATLISLVLITFVAFLFIYFFVRNMNQKMNAKWLNKKVSIPAVAMIGEVIGWTSTRDSFFLRIRLDNGNILTISTDQAIIIPIPLTNREKEIKKLEDELESLKGVK